MTDLGLCATLSPPAVGLVGLAAGKTIDDGPSLRSGRRFTGPVMIIGGGPRGARRQLTRGIMKKGLRNPSSTSRQRTHGFRVRMATAKGRLVINRRRAKGRHRLAVDGR